MLLLTDHKIAIHPMEMIKFAINKGLLSCICKKYQVKPCSTNMANMFSKNDRGIPWNWITEYNNSCYISKIYQVLSGSDSWHQDHLQWHFKVDTDDAALTLQQPREPLSGLGTFSHNLLSDKANKTSSSLAASFWKICLLGIAFFLSWQKIVSHSTIITL